MKKYQKIAAALTCAVILSWSAFAAKTAAPFKDIDNYWGKPAIQYFYDRHYVSGMGDEFKPNEDITREGAASILNNIIGGTDEATVDFKDVKGRWSEKAIASMVDKQIMNGYEDGTFKPERAITRQEFAVIAYNYMNYKGVAAQKSAVDYKDEKDIAPWAKTAVDTLTAVGYMKGSNDMFLPQRHITRGEAVNVLYRVLTGNSKTQAEEKEVEKYVFSHITKVYGSVKKFSDDGAMYWQGDTLNVIVKKDANRSKLEGLINGDDRIADGSVVVRKGAYSYNDYKKMQNDALRVYKEKEGKEATVAVDYLNEEVVLTAPAMSDSTQRALKKAVGKGLRIIVAEDGE